MHVACQQHDSASAVEYLIDSARFKPDMFSAKLRYTKLCFIAKMPYRTSKITKRTVTFTVFVYNSVTETSKIANVTQPY